MVTWDILFSRVVGVGIAVTAEVAGGHAAMLQEDAVEGALVLEAAGIGGLADGLIGGKHRLQLA